MKKLTACLVVLAATSFAAPAPTFRGEALDGRTLTLQENLKTGRHLLVCFWATWCEPCMQELRLVSKHLPENPTLDLISVNVDAPETANQVRPTARLNKFQFPILMDQKHEIFQKYNTTETLPFSVLVNAKGEIVRQFSGYSEEMFAQISTTINQEKKANAKTQ